MKKGFTLFLAMLLVVSIFSQALPFAQASLPGFDALVNYVKQHGSPAMAGTYVYNGSRTLREVDAAESERYDFSLWYYSNNNTLEISEFYSTGYAAYWSFSLILDQNGIISNAYVHTGCEAKYEIQTKDFQLNTVLSAFEYVGDSMSHELLDTIASSLMKEILYDLETILNQSGKTVKDIGFTNYPSGHHHTWGNPVVVEQPSCIYGIKELKCSGCSSIRRYSLKPIGNHSWSEWTIVEPASCTSEGYRTRQCNVCMETETETIPALGHAWTLTETWVNPMEENNIHAWTSLYTCSRCNETKEGRLCAGEVFKDMPPEGFWSHDPIDWAWLNGITGGTGPDTFSPDLTVTRSQVVTFLWAAAEKPAPETTTSPFTDVKEGDWFLSPVLWAVENGITGGVGNNQFGPGAVCTRSQIVTFLWAAAGKPEPEMTESPFTDVKEGDWYLNAVLWAVENGVTGGVGNNQFGPDLVCTRAQAVTFLYKASQIPASEEP